MELELHGAGTPARNEPKTVGVSGRSSRAASVLRWFITVIVFAAFLGLVRAGAATLPGLARAGAPQRTWPSQWSLSFATCSLCDLGHFISLADPQFNYLKHGHVSNLGGLLSNAKLIS